MEKGKENQKRRLLQKQKRRLMAILTTVMLFLIPLYGNAQLSLQRDLVSSCSHAPTIVNVLGNDDIRGCTTGSIVISLSTNTKVQHGRVSIDADNKLVYTSDSGFVGLDSLVYVVNCNGNIDSSTVVLTVYPTPVVYAINHVYCSEDTVDAYYFTGSVAGATYHWQRVIGQDVDSIGLSQTSGVDSIPSFVTHNKGIYPLNPWYQVTPYYTENGFTCSGTTENFLITINPTPTMADIVDQYYCDKQRVAAYEFTGDIPDAHYSWRFLSGDTLNGLLLNGSNQIPAFIAQNDSLRTLTARYEVTPSYAYANKICTGIADTFSINVFAHATLKGTKVLPAICSGDPIQTTLTSNTQGVTFSWEREPNAGINEIPRQGQNATIKDTLTNNTNQIVNVRYAVTINTGYCNYVDYVTVSVYPKSRITSSLQQNACNGASFMTVLTSNVLGSTFSWQRLANPAVTGTAGTGNTATINEVLTNLTDTSNKVKYAITVSNNGCITRDTLTVTLAPRLQLNPADTVTTNVCSGNMVVRNLTSQVSGVTYSWTREFNANITPYNGSGSGSGSGSPILETLYNSSTTPQTVFYNVTLSTANGCSQTQQIKTVINPLPKATLNASVVTMAVGGRKALAVTSGNVAAQVTSADTTIVKASVLASHDSVILNARSVGTTTITYSVTDPVTLCTGKYEVLVSVTLNPLATLAMVGNNVVCNGDSTMLEITEISHGTAPWTLWINYTGSGLAPKQVTVNSASDLPKRVSITPLDTANTVQSYYYSIDSIRDQNGSVGRANSGYIKIDVMPKPKIDPVTPASQSLCNGSMSTPIYLSGSANTFNWIVDKNIGLPLQGSGDILSFQAMNPNNAADTAKIKINSFFQQADLYCKGDSTTAIIVVQRMPKVNNINDTIVCSGTSLTVNFSGNADSYKWIAAPEIGLPANENASRLQFTPNNINTQSITSRVTVTPVYTINPSMKCEGASVSFNITVNPMPTLSSTADQDYCNGVFVSPRTFNSNLPQAQFVWRKISGDSIIGLPSNGNTQIPAFVAQNTGGTIRKTNYEVTATYSYGNVTCGRAKDTFSITIQPTLKVNFIAEQKYCAGKETDSISFGDTTNAIYKWKQISGLDIGLPNNGQGTNKIPSFVTKNITATVQTAIIEVTPTTKNGHCPGQTMQFSITVNPEPRLISPLKMDSICSGNRFEYTCASNTQNVYYQWVRKSIPGINNGDTNSGQGTRISEVLNNITNSPIEVKYFVTVGFENCSDNIDTVTVVVKPTAGVQLAAETNICYGESEVYIQAVTTNPLLPVYYKITYNVKSLEAGFQNMNSYQLLSSDSIRILLPSGAVPGSYLGTMSIQSNGCSNTNTYSFVITVLEPTAITSQPQSEIILCNTDTEIRLEVVAVGSNLSYQWYRNGSPIAYANQSVYEKQGITSADYGIYTVDVIGICSTVRSSASNVRLNDVFILQKWDDVLFVSGRDSIGNKTEYTRYQWYRLDNRGKMVAISEKGNSQYYTEEGITGTFAVEVFRADGTRMMSCPYTIVPSTTAKIKVYPNPIKPNEKVTVFLSFGTKKVEGSKIEVYDILGKRYAQVEVKENKTELYLNVATGTYLFRITDPEGNITTEKVIIK